MGATGLEPATLLGMTGWSQAENEATLTPSLEGGGHVLAHQGNRGCSFARLSRERASKPSSRAVSEGVARRRGASRVPEMYPRRTRVLLRQTTKNADLQAFYASPLTDSNRRPPPYHRATRREPRVRPGRRGHESRARRRNCPKTSNLAWTRVPAMVFPQRSLDTWGRRGAVMPARLARTLVCDYSCPRFRSRERRPRSAERLSGQHGDE
jgi:hypothetical protein